MHMHMHMHTYAQAELTGLRAEKKLTQRFRAPQTHAILTAALKLLQVCMWMYV